MFRQFVQHFQRSVKHEPHLYFLAGLVGIAPVLTCCTVAWTFLHKNDVKLIRFGKNDPWSNVSEAVPKQTFYTHASRRPLHVGDPVIAALQREIYDYDDFERY